MTPARKLRLRFLAALSGTLVFGSALPLGCSSGEPSKDDVMPSCNGGTPTVECYPPGATHFNQGNVLNPPPPPQAHFDAHDCQVQDEVSNGCCNAAVTGPDLIDGQCCYGFCTGACCGRPLLVQGEPRLASVSLRGDWTSDLQVTTQGLSADERRALAEQWLGDARLEHASIASFARFALDLLAFGAPAELLERAQLAIGDELRHARACFALASAYAGSSLGPGPMDLNGVASSPNLAAAAAAAAAEGCINETIAALAATEQARTASDPTVRRVLTEIARDEAEHAELGWRFVKWALGSGDANVSAAVRAALRQAPTPDSPSEPSLRRHGRLNARELAVVARTAWSDVIAPCAAALS